MLIEVSQSHGIPIDSSFSYSDCDDLRKSIKGAEIDENIIIDILGNRTTDQRLKIRDRYRKISDRVRTKIDFPIHFFFCLSLQDFDADLKKDTSRDFRHILKALFYSPVEYDCHELHRAIKGLGTNEEILIEILITRSNKRLQAISNLYPKCNDIFFSINLFRFVLSLKYSIKHLKKTLLMIQVVI